HPRPSLSKAAGATRGEVKRVAANLDAHGTMNGDSSAELTLGANVLCFNEPSRNSALRFMVERGVALANLVSGKFRFSIPPPCPQLGERAVRGLALHRLP